MLNEVLKLVRSYHRLDQQTAAERLGISKSYLSEVENGKKDPTLRLLHKYQEQFGLPSSSLLLISESLKSGRQEKITKKAISILKWAAE